MYDSANDVLLTDAIEVDVFEIKNLPNDSKNDEELVQWLRFIKSKEEEEFKMLAAKNIAINKAFCVLKELSADERERMIADDRDQFIRDRNSQINGSFRKGKAEGQSRGQS
jgi:hypothetical protein